MLLFLADLEIDVETLRGRAGRGGYHLDAVPAVLGRLEDASQRLASLGMFLGLLAVIGLALGRVRNLTFLDRMLDRLEDRSAQLRVRAALTLALAFAVLADRFGFASILGAFAAGLLVQTIDLAGRAPHPQFQIKLEGIGFGFLVPVFFITTGIRFDTRAP